MNKEKPPDNMPILFKPKPAGELPKAPPPPVSPVMWVMVVVLFVVSLFVLARVVVELKNRPLPAQQIDMITPLLLPSPTSTTSTRQPTPTLAPTATPSPTITPSPTATSTTTATPFPTPTPTAVKVPATVAFPPRPLANWNSNFQFVLLPTPTPLPPVSAPPLETHWQAYVVSGMVAVNWVLAVVAFLMWRGAGLQSVTPPPLVVNMPALPPSPPRVVGRNDARLPIQQIVAISAPPPPHSPLLTAPPPLSPVTGGITGDITGDGDSVTSDEWLSPVTSPVMAGAVRLPIVPPRPLVGEEIAYCRELHRNGMSKNQLCVNFFGGKNPRRMSFITEALDEH